MPVRPLILFFLILLTHHRSSAQISHDELISIHSSGRYFVDGNDQPLLWQGDTEWELFHLFSVADAKIFLKERKSQGFNIIQVMITGVYPEWGEVKGVNYGNAREAWMNQNPLSPAEEYFKRTDSIISIASEYGIILVIGVYHAIDVEKGRINIQNARAWAAWLTSRYKNNKNIIWSMYPHADSSSMPIIKASIDGIREGDGGLHLITMHPDPSPKSSSFLHREEWLAFNTLQTWSSKFINYEMVRADYDKIPVKPVVNGEARYEAEDGTTAFETRRAGYWSYLAGGSYSYGHRDNWNAPSTWRTWYLSEGATQMKIMGDIFRSVEWWKLVPDQSVFVETTEGNVAAISAGKDFIIAYLAAMKPVTIKLNLITALKVVRAWWLDPLTGRRIKIGSFETSGSRLFSPPINWQDAVLLIGK